MAASIPHPDAEARAAQILTQLKAMGDPENVAGMARFGIRPDKNFGVSIPPLRRMAKELGRDPALAEALWVSGYREARILATLVADPRRVEEAQMERWVQDLDSWDVCDALTGNLLDRTPMAYEKAVEWSGREAEFVKRAGFALMAWLAVHDKKASDERFRPFSKCMLKEAGDERNFVKKALNWALRSIGKRNRALNAEAIAVAQEMARQDSRTARWIANDALRELTSEKLQSRLKETGDG